MYKRESNCLPFWEAKIAKSSRLIIETFFTQNSDKKYTFLFVYNFKPSGIPCVFDGPGFYFGTSGVQFSSSNLMRGY